MDMDKKNMLERVVKAARKAYMKGFAAGSGGNVSIRIQGQVYISPSGICLGDLTQEEQSALLIAKFGVSARQEETVVTVNFIDFNTDRPLVSCQGAYTTLGFSANADIKGALRRVGEQISKTFNR